MNKKIIGSVAGLLFCLTLLGSAASCGKKQPSVEAPSASQTSEGGFDFTVETNSKQNTADETCTPTGTEPFFPTGEADVERIYGDEELLPDPGPASIGLEYAVSNDGGSLMVTGLGTCTDKKIVVPSSIDRIPVTGVAAFAFFSKTVESVYLPDSVRLIERGAFWGCGALESISLPFAGAASGDPEDGRLAYIFEAMADDTNGAHTLPAALRRVTVRGGKKIADSAFADCAGIEEITVAGDVSQIGKYAFSGCTSLKLVSFGSEIVTVGKSAFEDCTALERVTLGINTEEIGPSAFKDCVGIRSLVLPENVKSIGSSAFSGCTSLRTLTLCEGLETIGKSAFYGCTSLRKLTLPENVSSIGDTAFYGCTGLTDVFLPASAEKLGSQLFRGCTALVGISVDANNKVYSCGGNCVIRRADKTLVFGCGSSVIPTDGSVEAIGAWAFSDCALSSEFTVPDGVRTIGSGAFMRCLTVEEVHLGKDLAKIDDNAFSTCTALRRVKYAGSFADWQKVDVSSVGNAPLSKAEFTYQKK